MRKRPSRTDPGYADRFEQRPDNLELRCRHAVSYKAELTRNPEIHITESHASNNAVSPDAPRQCALPAGNSRGGSRSIRPAA